MTRLLLVTGALLFAACGSEIEVAKTPNLDPEGLITSPISSTVYYDDEVIPFTAIASDGNGITDIASVSWVSSEEGPIGDETLYAMDEAGTSQFSDILPVGTHVITFSVVDSQGAAAQDTVTISIGMSHPEPVATITSPTNFESFYATEIVDITGIVSDPKYAPDEIAISWSLTDQGTGAQTVLFDGYAEPSGQTATTWTAELGNWVLRLDAENGDTFTGYDEIYVVVTDVDDEDLDADGFSPNQGDCDDGDPTVYPGAPEICGDNIDNDCNGFIDDKDDDADDHIDEDCVNYTGALPIDDCDDSDAYIYTGAPELEDGIDNDCDGDIDEGTGAFDDDGDCFCETGPCIGSVNPACVSQAGGDCDDNDIDVAPNAADEPDLAYIDSNCDDIDGDLSEMVYLDPTGGLDSNSGLNPNAPVLSLDEAYTVAVAQGFTWIAVAAGNPPLSGDLVEGISIAGGYDTASTWARTASIMPEISVSSDGLAVDNWAISTEYQQMRFEAGTTSTASASSFALTIVDSQGLLFSGCELVSGGGGDGAAGLDGASGTNGTDGTNGSDGCEDSGGFCSSCSTPSTGSGGAGCNSANGGSGGAPGKECGGGSGGGDGSPPTTIVGSGSASGNGGSGGGNESDGATGGSGGDGDDGGNGTPGNDIGTFDASGYLIADGGGGDAGDPGGGAGGGGGGGGTGCGWGECDTFGGAGGGAGGGACGGEGALGGVGGGSSVAILLVNSTINIQTGTLTTGNGGDGGDGGNGGAGGAGGDGGTGGSDATGILQGNSGSGGYGGDGGDGGAGGDGGGGGGGPSVGVVCRDNSVLNLDPATVFTIGNGGTGGSSSSAPGSDGLTGQTDGCN